MISGSFLGTSATALTYEWPANAGIRKSPSIAFIRIRSPSSAPPDRRREGSIASTATLQLNLRIQTVISSAKANSSVREDLPDPTSSSDSEHRDSNLRPKFAGCSTQLVRGHQRCRWRCLILECNVITRAKIWPTQRIGSNSPIRYLNPLSGGIEVSPFRPYLR